MGRLALGRRDARAVVGVRLMIGDAVLALLGGLLGLFAEALPAAGTGTLWGAPPDLDDMGTDIGRRVAPLHNLIPIGTVFHLLSLTFKYVLPALVTYSGIHWVYKHLPIIGKG